MTISFLISESLKKCLEEQARLENRSLSNYCDTIIKRYLKSKGIEWEGDEEENDSD